MTAIDYAGVTLDGDADALTPAVRRALRQGEYEREETECVELYLDPEDDVVELGGGIGYLACYVDQRLTDDRTHVVVEPNGRLLSLVERHRVLNDASFETVAAAYATDGPLASLSVPESFWEASTVWSDPGDRVAHAATVDLETLLDAFGLSEVALIVDIEGGELALLADELDVLVERCRIVIVEFHHEAAPYETAEAIRWAKARIDTSAFDLVDEKGAVAVYRAPDG
jgi:FkbM family methyltransferase